MSCFCSWRTGHAALKSACFFAVTAFLGTGFCIAQMTAYSGSEHLAVSGASAKSAQQLLADLAAARQLLDSHPSAQANLALGRALKSLGETEPAARYFDRAIELDPKLADAWLEKGLLVSDQGDWSKAADFFRRSLAISPEYVAAHLALAEALLRIGQFDDSANELNTTLRLDPDSSGAHQGLGLIYLQQGKPELGVEQFRLALMMSPDSVAAEKGLARAYAAQHRWPEAFVLLTKVASADPQSSEAATALGNALANTGDKSGADAQFERARELSRKELNLLRAQGDRNWGVALRNQGKLQEAAAVFRRALDDDPDYCDAHDDLGEVLWMQKDSAAALSQFQAAVSCAPNSATARNNLGANLLYYKHDVSGAIEQFRAAVALKPGFATAHLNLGKALAAKQEWSEAEPELRSAIAIDPESAAAHVNLGLVLDAKSAGNSTEALLQMQQGLKLDPRLRAIIPQQYLSRLDPSHPMDTSHPDQSH
jgi:tetratricopeptide (TPR) repeat protein